MKSVFRRAFTTTIPVMAGYIVLGIGFGLLLKYTSKYCDGNCNIYDSYASMLLTASGIQLITSPAVTAYSFVFLAAMHPARE